MTKSMRSEADTESNDRPLHERIASRERGALEELVANYSPSVLFLIYRMIEGYGEMEDAQEITQDVFLKAWDKIAQFDPEMGQLKTWINGIAKYAAIDFRRKTDRRRKILPGVFEQSEYQAIWQNQPSAAVLDDFELEKYLEPLADAITQLPEDWQLLVKLRFVEDLTYDQISELTGKPVGTVKSGLFRIMSRLRTKLSKTTEDGEGIWH